MITVVIVALSSEFAPGIFRLICIGFLIVVFCGLCMELKRGQEAQEELRRIKRE